MKVIRNFGRENGIFSEKTSFRNLGPRKILRSRQTRRQVLATAIDNINTNQVH